MRIKEGGNATAAWGTSRATQSDMKIALQFMARVSGISYEELTGALLGSTEMTMLGIRPESGDVDIAVDAHQHDMHVVHDKVMAAIHDEGTLQSGLRTGSYAIPVANGRKIQVDLMFFDSPTWAKFMYHSDEGRHSKYKGVVRNQLLMACVRHMIHPGDMVVKNDDGEIIARASRSIDPNKGMRRIFKMATINKRTGTLNKTLSTATPEEIKARYPDAKFIDKEDLINDPVALVHALFGPGVEPSDIMTVESLMDVIKRKIDDSKLREVIGIDAATTLDHSGIPYPPELKSL